MARELPLSFRAGELEVFVDRSAAESAARAAADFAAAARRLLLARDELNVVFAGAESQQPFHRALAARADIAWPRINAFAVDEFHSPGMPAELAVSAEPKRELYARVPVRSVNVLDPSAPDPGAECRRYAAMLAAHPPDIACIGIGCSGHLALNEPGQADFADRELVRVVEVCAESRRQLQGDPNFKALGKIPERGLTMTIPAILRAEFVQAIVPYALKAAIVKRFLASPVGEALPATALKAKPGARLYLDREAYGLCPPE